MLGPPSWPDQAALARTWPLRDFFELGALPGAVPCARYHCRQVLWEWHLTDLSDSAKLLVSELMTNAVTACQSMGQGCPVRLWLLANAAQVAILVQDDNPSPPSLQRTTNPAAACSWWKRSAAGGAGTCPEHVRIGKVTWALLEVPDPPR